MSRFVRAVILLSMQSLFSTQNAVNAAGLIAARENTAAARVVSLLVQPVMATHENYTYYVTNVTVGSNSKCVPVTVDILSSTSGFNNNCTSMPESLQWACQSGPPYDPKASNSSHLAMNASEGNTYHDKFVIGDVTLNDFDFMVDSPGLTYRMSSLSLGQENHLGRSLVTAGAIKNQAFGLDLGYAGRGTGQGSLVFGGIDTKKYRCKLERFPYDNPKYSYTGPSGDKPAPYVTVNGVSLSFSGAADRALDAQSVNPFNTTWTDGAPYSPQNGIQFSIVHRRLLHAIGLAFPRSMYTPNLQQYSKMDIESGHPGTTLPPGVGSYIVPCEAPEGAITFMLGKATNVSIPWSNFIIQMSPGQCALAMFASVAREESQDEDGHYYFGSKVLEHAYMVFDYDNQNVWLGESDDCGSSVVPVGSENQFVPMVDGCNCGATNNTHEDEEGRGAMSKFPQSMLGLLSVAVLTTVFIVSD